MKGFIRHTGLLATLTGIAALAALFAGTAMGGKPPLGTTLAAFKTLDICEVTPAEGETPSVWRYSGEIAIWNQGAIDTVGLAIDDWIQTKEPGRQYYNLWQVLPGNFDPAPHEAAAGTTQETADVYTYVVEGGALDPLYIRNVANITILNHASHVGTAFGPSPKATWDGGVPPPCDSEIPGGCVYTQGYWGDKPDVVWPAPYSRGALFFLSEQTWQQVMDTPVNVSQGYYQLAHQYIAAVLNQANGASVPQGVQDTLDLAVAWFGSEGPSACTGNVSCGTQKDWAAVLDSYNNGLYPGGPEHCE